MHEDASLTAEPSLQQQKLLMPNQVLDELDGMTSAAMHSAQKHMAGETATN